jgi:hypothetical protein
MRIALASLSIFLLSGCATMTGTVGTKAACTVWSDISWSKKDTDQTIAEIKRNNARRDGFCRGG